MKFKCDKCDKPATVHLTDIGEDNQTVAKHLCADCATSEGLHVPIGQLLEGLTLANTAEPGEELTCDVCGMTFAEFQSEARLGCPNDYDTFAQPLTGLLEHAHEGACQHLGKVPHRAGGDQQKQTAVLRLRAELKSVIAIEDYERAAAIRDQIHQLEDL